MVIKYWCPADKKKIVGVVVDVFEDGRDRAAVSQILQEKQISRSHLYLSFSFFFINYSTRESETMSTESGNRNQHGEIEKQNNN